MAGHSKYYRPIQYLGSKIRIVDTIVKECQKLYTPENYVLDLFSGSSIVAQSLYNNGMNVIANDAMSFSSDIAACMLNQDRKKCSISNVEAFVSGMVSLHTLPQNFMEFSSLIDKERQLLDKKDLLGLKVLYDNLSQVGSDRQASLQVDYIRKHAGCSAINNYPLFANYYAGTYFGIRQALEIDVLRNAIETEWNQKCDLWERKVLLTALYNTCSIIVHSVGKHFAQPIQINGQENKITNTRLFENRNYNVFDVFKTCIMNIISSIAKNDINSTSYSLCMDICSPTFRKLIADKNVDVIYADPPYTAQQYSRFYHIPEVLHSYKYPKLQMFRGKYTQGIYPEEKYKSPFCSKIKAKGAFEFIFDMAQKHDCSLIVSYSESKKQKTGNERMVTLEYLLQLAHKKLPHPSLSKINFDFDYRQLNRSDKIVENKDDKEILLIFKKQ